jgi:peptide/nickel transport system substrate-binding protein
MTNRARIRQCLIAAGLVLAGCRADAPSAGCADCGVVRIIAVREPPTIFPPLVQETVGRDVSDRIYQRLAVLKPGASTLDPSGYKPQLAQRWERVDSLTWRFTLAPGRWHDGQPVTAGDVAFSFGAFTDSTLGGARGSALRGVRAEVESDATLLVRFPRWYPEQLYDATWHVRVVPRHIWSQVPPAQWSEDTSLARLVGSGPYRAVNWQRGQFLTLEADTSWTPRPAATRLVWRFAPDPDAALNLMLADEGDLLEQVGNPALVERVRGDTSLRTLPYPAAVYGFAAFQLADRAGSPSVFQDRAVRRALTLAVDRTTLARAVFGPATQVPVGPVSRLGWIGSDAVRMLPYDSARADALLDEAGWRRDRSGVRQKAGVPLRFGILVPSTSGSRRMAAEALQATWRGHGALVDVEAVDFPVFQQRLAEGKFDVYIGAYLDEPSPRGMLDQWSREGWGALNHGRYANAAVDSLMRLAVATAEPPLARAHWAAVLDSLNADAPGIFLYAPVQVAVASTRLDGVSINPWSWLDGIERWGVVGEPLRER